MHFSIPTLKELEAQVRSRSVGRTIVEICLDLGITPTFCEGKTWDEILQAIVHFGGNFAVYFETQQRRQKAFLKEREQRPETWTSNLHDRQREAYREVLGCLIGEPPPADPAPDGPLAAA